MIKCSYTFEKKEVQDIPVFVKHFSQYWEYLTSTIYNYSTKLTIRINSVITVFLENAFEYSKSSTIIIDIEADNSKFTISCSNEIEDKDYEKIEKFINFMALDKSHSQSYYIQKLNSNDFTGLSLIRLMNENFVKIKVAKELNRITIEGKYQI